MTDQFDWGSLGQSWWEETGKECRASPQQVRFACARHQGSTRSKAAALANYSGSPEALRSAGSRADDSKAVQDLLALAAAAEAGTTDNPVTIHEAKIKVGKLVRSVDPTIALKASELFVKLEVAENARGESPEHDGFDGDRLVRSLLLLPNGGTLAMLLQAGTSLSCMCLFHDMRHRLQTEQFGPMIWDALYEQHSENMKEDIADKIADPTWQGETRVKLWNEIAMRPCGPIGVVDRLPPPPTIPPENLQCPVS